MQTLAWSFSAGATGGALNLSGQTDVDAVISAEVALDAAMASQTPLTLQIEDVDKVLFLAISSSLQDGSVEIAVAADAIPMTGPLILFGKAVALFASDLTTLNVQNKSVDSAASLKILIGIAVAP